MGIALPSGDELIPMRSSTETLVRLEGVTVNAGTVDILRVAELTLAPGELILLTGANGSGKSTLLKVLAGALDPTQGRVVTEPGLRAVMVRDTPYLYDVLTPPEHVDFIARLWRRPVDADEYAASLGLTRQAATFARDLSLGQRQRLALGLALLGDPSLLLLDEPLNGLDEANAAAVVDMVRAAVDAGCTCVVATHVTERIRPWISRHIRLEDGGVVRDDSGPGLVQGRS